MPVSTTGERRVLVVEPDPGRGERVRRILSPPRYDVTLVAGAAALAERLKHGLPDAIVVSLGNGTRNDDALGVVRRRARGVPVLLVAPAERAREAVERLGPGAEDYLVGPPDAHELTARLERILDRQELDSRMAFLQEQLSKTSSQVEARSPAMRRVLERLERVAPMRSTVLINGESGVGKELIARMIHFNSPRRDEPFIALNCAAIPTNLIESELFGHERGAFTGAHARSRGKFEIAHRGTLFLDEIGDMDPATQAKLLRVLEQREFMRVGGDRSLRVDVRLIAATNADLETLVAGGDFRRDLYYRLKVVTLTVPPLRERRADIPPLVEHFLDELARANGVARKTIAPEALAALHSYHWPGNVRELKNLIESVLVSLPGETVGLDDLPLSLRQSGGGERATGLTPGTTLAEMEKELIRVTLEHTGGNRTHSASLLGIGVRTLQRKIRLYGLTIAPRRRRPRRRGDPSPAASG